MNARPRIILCSLFKPVDDTRMYEKLAFSLAETNRFEIIVIGHDNGSLPAGLNITFLPLFRLNRLSLSRAFIPLKLFYFLIKLKPKIIINNSIDFLLLISLYKMFTKSKIIYDIQENYYFNIRYNRYFPSLIKYGLAQIVRLVEKISASSTDLFFLAEKTYARELPFLEPGRFVVLENKFADIFTVGNRSKKPATGRIDILYSGTIAEHYGIFEIIRFIKDFHAIYENINLIIIGHCPHRPTYRRLLNLTGNFDFIHLNAADKPLPHLEILQAIQKADFGIMNYKINPSTEHRMPTRLFEYMAIKLPVLIQDHKPWSERVLKEDSGIVIDFEAPDYDTIYNKLITNEFYSNFNPNNYSWYSEKERLLRAIDVLLSDE